MEKNQKKGQMSSNNGQLDENESLEMRNDLSLFGVDSSQAYRELSGLSSKYSSSAKSRDIRLGQQRHDSSVKKRLSNGRFVFDDGSRNSNSSSSEKSLKDKDK